MSDIQLINSNSFALQFDHYRFFNKVATARDALFCSVAKNNKLPIFTKEIERYKNSGMKIITPKELRG